MTGNWTITRDQRAGTTNLENLGRATGLDALIFKNHSQGNVVSRVTMTATVEAVLGAVWMDCSDLGQVSRVMAVLGL